MNLLTCQCSDDLINDEEYNCNVRDDLEYCTHRDSEHGPLNSTVLYIEGNNSIAKMDIDNIDDSFEVYSDSDNETETHVSHVTPILPDLVTDNMDMGNLNDFNNSMNTEFHSLCSFSSIESTREKHLEPTNKADTTKHTSCTNEKNTNLKNENLPSIRQKPTIEKSRKKTIVKKLKTIRKLLRRKKDTCKVEILAVL